MFKNYQNMMLRLVVILLAGFAAYLVVERWLLGIYDLGIYRVPELLVVAGGLWWLVKRFPRSNYGAWMLVAYLVVSNAAWMGLSIMTYGRISTNSLFVLPLLFFFFMGTLRGLIVNCIFLAWLFLLLPMYNWNPGVYGEAGTFFLVTYIAVVVISYALEWIRARVREQSSQIAEVDPLTLLPNRSGFLLQLEAEIGRNEPFALVQMDLDHFRRINLSTGSQYADKLLKRVAECLRQIPDIRFVARHYGDEFAFVTGESEELIREISERIQKELDFIAEHSEFGISLTASFGASRFPENSLSGQELWGQAEMALRKAKEEGRVRLRLYNDRDARMEKDSLRMAEALRHDIENQRIQVFFQPKICIQAKAVCGMEALARWEHVEWGMVSPAVFIPLAEQHGQIVALGNQVFERSVEFLREMKSHGWDHLSVSVNVSVAQLSQQNLPESLAAVCEKHGVEPGAVYLEITESMLLHGGMSGILNDLRAVGFKLSLDDFGTGYSSMSYLHRYRFDELKVDKSFTDGLMRSGRERHVFRSILELSRGLGMKTVVEGVETPPQVMTIRDLGAPEIQGWVFAKAMPAHELEDFVRDFDFDALLHPVVSSVSL